MKILITGGSGFIGTNLIEMLRGTLPHFTLLNIDIKAPFLLEQKIFWKSCNLLNSQEVESIVDGFQPDFCIHLAAETEMKYGSDIISDYPVNTTGSEQFLKILKKYNVKRSLIVSTQYVCGPSEKLPLLPEEYWPHTAYGESKVILEKNTRAIMDPGTFVILRPTYIWGPWHYKNFLDLVKVIEKGFYFHPSGEPVLRSYGYVKNICSQIIKLLIEYDKGQDWFYVGDPVMDSYKFVNQLSMGLIGRPVIRVPRKLLFVMSKVGDFLGKFCRVPINSFRYRNMVTSYKTPMDPTISAFGKPLFSFEDAVKDYCHWRKSQTISGQNEQ